MNYWEKRRDALYKALEKDELALRKRLSRIYQAESTRLDKEIASYFSKYGENNVIEYRTLLGKLSDADKTLLFERWDDFAKKYPQYQDLMPVRMSIYNLDRLQGLQYSIAMQQLELGAIEQDQIKAHLDKTAYRAANTTAQTMGFGKDFYSIDSEIVKRFVDVDWSGAGKFSTTIWKNKQKLTNYLNTDLAQGFARGDSYKKLTDNLLARFEKVSRNDAYRLIYTEGTFVANQTAMIPFEEYFDQYKISTMEDGKVCSICTGIAEQAEMKPFLIKDRVVGENFPPFHPWCRCTFDVVVDNWTQWLDNYKQQGGDALQAAKIQKNLAPSNATAKAPTLSSSAPKINTKKIKGQYKNTDLLGRYTYYTEEQEAFRLESIKKLTGFSNDKAEKVLKAFCGSRNEYLRLANKGYDYVECGWFEGADRKIRGLVGDWSKAADEIRDYIYAAPKYEGTAYRGLALTQSEIDAMDASRIFKESPDNLAKLASWSSSKDKAAIFAGEYAQGDKIPVIVELTNPSRGTPIAHLSIWGNTEDEIIVSSLHNDEYIIKSLTQENDIVRIIVEEK